MSESSFEKYVDNYTFSDKLKRLMWNICWLLLVRPWGLPFFYRWRSFVYKMCGAKIGVGSKIHASAKIWAPWNLKIGERTCIGPHTIIYNPGMVILRNKVTISQYSYLCTATHNYTSPQHTLYWKSIIVDDFAWVAARSFVGPGVHIGEGAIVGATASVYKDVAPWTIVGGNPAKVLKIRVMDR